MSRETTATGRSGATSTIDVSPPAPKATDIRVLIVDDSEDDALVAIRELKHGGYSPTFERVETAEAMVSALKDGHWDVIICDYIMPSFSGLAALDVLKASGLDLPFILVSGKVGEEKAVEAMRAGATDYVMKDRLNRLVPAIRREMAEALSRRGYRKAALSLKQSEERYQALAENYADVVWVTDMDGQVTYVSPSVIRLLGYSVEELMVHDIDLTPASLKASMKAAAQALRAEKEGKADSVLGMTPVELELRRKDGSTAWASVSFAFIPDSDGRPVETVAILHDITERKQVEDATRRAAQHWRTTFDSISDLVSIHDRDFRMVRVNRSLSNLFKMEPKEVIGRHCYELFHGTNGPCSDCPSVKTMKTKMPATLEMFHDGFGIHLEITTSPIFNAMGEVTECVHIARDITERKKAEQALRDSEARYRLVTSNVKDMMWTMDKDLKFTYVSPSVINLLGYTPEELAGMDSLKTLISPSPSSQNGAMQAISAAMNAAADMEEYDQSDKSPWQSYDLELQRKDGSTVWTENRIGFLRDPDGKPFGFVGATRDVTDRKRAEEAIGESEARYRLLAENSSDVIWTMDANFTYTYMSPSVTSLRGYSVEEAMALSMEETTTPTSLQTAMRVMAEAGAKEGKGPEGRPSSVTLELELTCKDGSTVWVENRITYLRDAEGRLTGYQGVSRDISARKKAEEIIGESESRYRLLAENASDVITVMDMNMRPVYMSPSITRLLGYSVEEAMARGIGEGLTPASFKSAAAAFAEVLAEEQKGEKQKPATMDLEFTRKDGSAVWVAISVSLIRNSDGQAVEVLSILHDITERKKTEEALRISEEKYRGLVENTNDLIYTTDAKGVISYMGPQIIRYGFTPEETVSRSFFDFVAPEDQERLALEYVKTIETGEQFPSEFRIVGRDGNRHWLEDFGKPFRDESGNVIGVSGVLRDLTDRKKAEEALRRARDSAQEYLDIAGVMLMAMDKEGRVTLVNRKGCAVLGYEEQDLIGKNWFDTCLPARLRGGVGQVFRRLMAGETELVEHYDNPVLTKQGEERIIAWHNIVLRDEAGNTIGALSSGEDVTERKRAEEDLRSSESRFKALFELSKDAMMLLTPKKGFFRGNPAAIKMFGCKDEAEFTTKTPAGLSPEYQPDGKPSFIKVQEVMSIAMEKGSHSFDWTYRRVNGEEFVADVLLTRIEWGGKKVLQGTVRDITQRRKADEELLKLACVVKRSSELVNLASVDGKMIFLNDAGCEMLGLDPKDVQQTDILQVIPNHLQEKVETELWPALMREGGTWEGNLQYRNLKTGQLTDVHAMTFRITDAATGALLCVANVSLDITERNKADDAVKQREAYFRTIIERSSDVITVLDGAGKVQYQSPNYETVWGRGPSGELGKDLLKDVHPDDAAAVGEAFGRLMERPEDSVRLEVRAQHEDRSWRVLNVEARNLLGHPAVHGIVVNFQDITERKKAEEALLDSEKRYRMLAENISDVIWVTDLNLQPVYTSPSIARLLGYSAEESMARRMEDSLTPASLKHAAETFTKILSLRESAAQDEFGTRPLELEFIRKDGTTIWTATTVSIMRDANGHPNAIMGVLHNITERKKAEEALLESEKRYRMLAENISDVIWVTDMNMQQVYVSPSVTRLFGTTAETAVANSIEKGMTPASARLAAENMARALALKSAPEQDEAASQPLELEMKREDGSAFWVSTSFSIIRDSGGRAVQLMGVLHDITQRKKSEEEVLVLSNAIKASLDAIVIVGMDGKIVTSNDAALRLYEVDKHACIGSDAMVFVAPEEREVLATALQEVITAGHVTSREFNVVSGRGHRVPVSASGSTIRDADGKPTGIVIVMRDITERKKAEESLRESEERLKILFEYAPDVYCLSTPEGTILDANKAAFELFGYQKEAVLGKTFMELGVLPSKQFEENSATTLRGPNEPLEMAINRKDGTKLTIEVKTFPVEIKGQTLLLSIARDITERKETLEAIRLSQEWFRNLVETTTDWVWESRGEGFYSYSNPQVRNILGYSPEEILGKTPSVFASPEEADRIYNIFSTAAKAGDSIRSLEHVFLHKNGNPVSLETSAVPFFTPGEALPGYRGITRDITERQQAKSRLQQTLNKLSRTMEGTVQSISRMVETKDPYTAGHQWRVTQLACAMAEEMGLSDEVVEAVRIAGLLHDLGKIGIPSEILSKPGRLSDTEFAIIKTHAQIGYDILKTVDFPWPIADIVLQHHERLNGTGYPRGLRSEEISLEAKILAVADVVEAMSSHRPYRPTLGTEKALEEIAKNSGTLYDSDAVYACLRLFSQKEFRFNEQLI